MYVIADIEWVNEGSPTQLAAIKVGEDWSVLDRFSSFIRSGENEFYDPKHVAYAGGSFNDYFYAPSLSDVLGSFLDWLGEGTLLWWFSPSKYKTQSTICSSIFGPAIAPSFVT